MQDQDRAARRHESERGERAEALLKNPLFEEAFNAVEQELMTRWKQDATLQQDGRERVFLMVTLLGQVKQVLMTHMKTGEMARMQLREHQEQKARGLRSIWPSRQ